MIIALYLARFFTAYFMCVFLLRKYSSSSADVRPSDVTYSTFSSICKRIFWTGKTKTQVKRRCQKATRCPLIYVNCILCFLSSVSSSFSLSALLVLSLLSSPLSLSVCLCFFLFLSLPLCLSVSLSLSLSVSLSLYLSV